LSKTAVSTLQSKLVAAGLIVLENSAVDRAFARSRSMTPSALSLGQTLYALME